jgi:hypothetical protein
MVADIRPMRLTVCGWQGVIEKRIQGETGNVDFR